MHRPHNNITRQVRANRVTRSATFLGVLVAMGMAVAAYQAAAFYQGYQPSADFHWLWDFVFALLLATWVDEDSRGRTDVNRPSFDLGLFVCLIWILYLPWYLLRTRGAMGWFWIAGLLLLALLGPILQVLIYAAS
jgi:hypothetical protein